MRLTNPILFGALALPIIPTVYSTTFSFYIPMELSNSDGVDFTSIIGKGNANSNQYDLKYWDNVMASHDDNRWCFDKSDSALGQPGVPMQQTQAGNCDDLPRYEGITDIYFETPTSEPQSLKISMPEYEVLCNMTLKDISEDNFQWFVDLGVWARKAEGIPNLDTFNIVCQNTSVVA